jgi:hypothetical protein
VYIFLGSSESLRATLRFPTTKAKAAQLSLFVPGLPYLQHILGVVIDLKTDKLTQAVIIINMAQRIFNQEEGAEFDYRMQTDYFLIVLVSGALVVFYFVITAILRSADNTEVLAKMNKVK